MQAIDAQISAELGLSPPQVRAAVTLLDEGSTVPFIARYRKEVTNGLDDTQLRNLEERLRYLRELNERREVVRNSIESQGKLDPALEAKLDGAASKTELEDLYLPFKKKRRTKAQIAREAGLAPLAQALIDDPNLDPQSTAASYVDADKQVADAAAALDGARQIIMEQAAERAALVARLRERLWDQGVLSSEMISGKAEEGAKFSDYFDYNERINKVPSHRALAMFRGRDAGVLSLKLDLPQTDAGATHPAEVSIAAELGIQDKGRPADKWLRDTVRWSWRVKLHTRLDLDLKTRLREQAEEEAIAVFSRNIKDVLMAAPAGARATLGLDPGIRTGVKVAIVDETGKVLATDTVYPHPPKRQWDRSIATLAALCKQHKVELVAIGNGTASRETDKLTAEMMAKHPELGVSKVMVNEAGASVYSASELAAAEFPSMDVSLRGAVSIARRLQDPLAELVKVEPKAIGVGQYQHDVNQTRLARALGGVVEDCVNGVGVNLNMASAPLLSHVSGLNKTLAKNVVDWRDANGAFRSRKQLLDVPRLGPVAYEQCAGFLRVRNGDNPLDASGVHPEAYGVAKRIVAKFGGTVDELIGHTEFLGKLQVNDFVDEKFGAPTVADIIEELHKPGRDPRPAFETAEFREGVETLNDLSEGMRLQGVVTNVTNFGAFVDIGVHQDGLVHISALADRYVKDPHDVVKAGDVVKVTVMEIDIKRRRVALSMRSDAKPGTQDSSAAPAKGADKRAPRREAKHKRPQQQAADSGSSNSAMADALRAAMKPS